MPEVMTQTNSDAVCEQQRGSNPIKNHDKPLCKIPTQYSVPLLYEEKARSKSPGPLNWSVVVEKIMMVIIAMKTMNKESNEH